MTPKTFSQDFFSNMKIGSGYFLPFFSETVCCWGGLFLTAAASFEMELRKI